ncbi:MAG: DUF4252 domain-containing protein [Bacteroidales bacterium]|nr:DUF4252 domain-containing protein [Bacteroidales bacterium]
MKKLIVLMIVAFVPAFLLAQNTPLSSLYDRYVSEPGFETTEILPGSMSFDWEKTVNNIQMKEMMQNIESIRIVKYKTDAGKADQDKLWKKMQKTAGDDQYTKVITVNAEKVQVNIFMIKGPAGNTREVAMLEKDEKGIMMVTVTGNMDFSAMFSPENLQSLREMVEYYMHNKGDCKPE